MSYIRAKQTDQQESAAVEHGFALDEVDFSARPDIDCNLDDEVLDFILELIAKVNALPEGEALVIWKEIW